MWVKKCRVGLLLFSFFTFLSFGVGAATLPVSPNIESVEAVTDTVPGQKQKATDTSKVNTATQLDTTKQSKQAASQTQEASDLYSRGVNYLNNNQPDSAAASLEEFLRSNPAHTDAQVNLARAYVELERYDEAEQTIDRAIQSDSTHAEAYVVQGRVLHSTGRLDEAASAYEKSIELNGENPYALNNLALVYIQQERFADAVPLLEKAVAQKNDVAFFYNNLGIAYEGSGNYQKAAEAFQSALNIDSGHEKARSNLERVQAELSATGTEADTTQRVSDKEP